MILKKLILAAAIQRLGPGPGPDPTPSDPFWDNVLILAHYDPATTYSDKKGHTVTRYGTPPPELNTLTSKFGGTSVRFNAEGQVIVYTTSEEERFGTDDFTIECFIFVPSATFTASRAIISTTPNNHNEGGFSFSLTDTGRLAFWDTTGTSTKVVEYPTPVTASTWHHVMASRRNGVVRIALDGKVTAGVSNLSDYTSLNVAIGGNIPPDGTIRTFTNGFIDEVRITRGVARYVSDFFPPNSPFLERAPGSVPQIGDYYNGGYYAGLMKNPDTGEMWRLIVAPKSGETNVAWKTTRTETVGTDSFFNGLANTQAMETTGIALHPAAQHCINYSNDGFDDWYLPARDELELLYRSFKPSAVENIVGERNTQAGGGLQGENANSVPAGPAYTLTSPEQTPVTQFKAGGSEALDSAANYYLCSTQSPLNVERCITQRLPSNGEQQGSLYKNANTAYTRPVRREAYIPPPPPPGPGEQGFGVGIAPEEWLAPLGLSEMVGTTDPTSDNYGNYQHTNGSICVFVPKFYYRIGSTESPRYSAYGLNCIDIVMADAFADEVEANAAGYALHRAFIDDGKEKPGFFYDKYLASRDGTEVVSVKNGQPISLTSESGYVTSVGIPGCTGILADAVVASRTRGAGWNCVSIFMADAIAKLSLAHGQYSTSTEFCAWYDSEGLTNFPKGSNNNLADVNDPSVTFISSGESSVNKPLTGSASDLAKTTHNGQACGITDVNGAMYQATIGVTQFGTSATSATQVTTGDCYVLKTTAKHADLTGGWNGATDAWGNTAGLANNFDAINSFLPWGSATGYIRFGNGSNQVFAFYLDNNDYRKLRTDTGVQGSSNFMSAAGISLFGNDGCYQYGRHNLVPMVAGNWNVSVPAGVFFRYWNYFRSHISQSNGFRAGAYGD